MIHSCYLDHIISFDLFEDFLIHSISVHHKRPKNKESLNNPKIQKAFLEDVKIQRAIFEKLGIVDLEKLV